MQEFAIGAAPGKALHRKQVYIVHGYTARPTDHWFPWLQERLAADGVAVEVLAMPDPDQPVAADWDAFLASHAARRDVDSFFVAHSLGCIGVVRHLLKTGVRCGGVVLVAGFAEPAPGLAELDGFVAGVDGIEGLRDTIGERVVIAARDDEAVPYEATRRLAERLDARFVTVEKGGHFLGREGFTEFPLVYSYLSAMLEV